MCARVCEHACVPGCAIPHRLAYCKHCFPDYSSEWAELAWLDDKNMVPMGASLSSLLCVSTTISHVITENVQHWPAEEVAFAAVDSRRP